MDKTEYQEKLAQINELVDDQDYDEARRIADTIEWKRVKSVRTLCMIADIYEQCDCLQDSKRILLMAYNRAQIGKSILSRLIEIALKLGDTNEAAKYYHEYIKTAGKNDASRFLLKYKIYQAQNAPIQDQIEALRNYKDREYTERWAYELARLYAKADMEEECVEECDDIILWFSEGLYVMKALELKVKYAALTPSQQDKYDHRYETTPELLLKPEKKRKKAKPAEPKTEEPVTEKVSAPAGTAAAETPAEPAAPAEDTAETAPEEAAPQPKKEEPVENVFTSTIDLQDRLSSGLKKVLGGLLHDDDDEPEEKISYEEAAQEETPPEMDFQEVKDLEPEQPTMKSAPRAAARTLPEGMEEEAAEVPETPVSVPETAAEDDFDLSSILEAQADAIATGREPDDVEEAATAPEETPEEAIPSETIDLSIVGNIYKEKKDAEEEPAAPEPAAQEQEPADDWDISIAEPEIDPEELKAWMPAQESVPAEEPAAGEAAPEMPEAEAEPEATELSAEDEIKAEPEVIEENTAEAEQEKAPEDDAWSGLSAALEAAVTKDLAAEVKKAPEAEFTAPAEAVTTDEPEAAAEEAPVEEEPDLLAKLEAEVERTMVHEELVPETPQEKKDRIIRKDRPSRLTDEQKRIFTYFAKIPGMDEQILDTIHASYNGAVNKTSRHGNIAIMGRKGTGKTRLSDGLVRALCKEFEMPAAKIARIDGGDMNDKSPSTVVGKMAGGFLMIENASRMSRETIDELCQAMEFRTDSMILILEDSKQEMRQMLADNSRLMEKIDSIINIPVFTNDELVTFARTYAGEMGYKMDEMGVLALYTIIGNNQSVHEPVSIDKVKEIMDGAIKKAGRRGGRKRQMGPNNRIIIHEKDFTVK